MAECLQSEGEFRVSGISESQYLNNCGSVDHVPVPVPSQHESGQCDTVSESFFLLS